MSGQDYPVKSDLEHDDDDGPKVLISPPGSAPFLHAWQITYGEHYEVVAGDAKMMAVHCGIGLELLDNTHKERDALRAEVERLTVGLDKINDIRNSIIGLSIIGLQTVNWSEHIYPLVAALNEAGIEGTPYEDGRKKFGALLNRAVDAEAEVERLREHIARGECNFSTPCGNCVRCVATRAILEPTNPKGGDDDE
jgi:hypothetical protein